MTEIVNPDEPLILPGNSMTDLENDPSVSMEMNIQRRLTHAFISRNPVNLELFRRERIATPSGGFKFGPGSSRGILRCCLVEPGGSNQNPPARASDGSERTLGYLLVAEFDASFDFDDYFFYDGDRYEIVMVMPENGYERRAAVERRGARRLGN